MHVVVVGLFTIAHEAAVQLGKFNEVWVAYWQVREPSKTLLPCLAVHDGQASKHVTSRSVSNQSFDHEIQVAFVGLGCFFTQCAEHCVVGG